MNLKRGAMYTRVSEHLNILVYFLLDTNRKSCMANSALLLVLTLGDTISQY